MKCDICGHDKTLLLVSYVCDRCDAAQSHGVKDRILGYAVYVKDVSPQRCYVFEDRDSAETFRQTFNHPEKRRIVAVYVRSDIRWSEHLYAKGRVSLAPLDRDWET